MNYVEIQESKQMEDNVDGDTTFMDELLQISQGR